jgi:hypothetical protein
MLKIIKKKDNSKKLMLKDVKENQLFRFVATDGFYLKARNSDDLNRNDIFIFFCVVSNTTYIVPINPIFYANHEVELFDYSLTLEYEEKEKKN